MKLTAELGILAHDLRKHATWHRGGEVIEQAIGLIAALEAELAEVRQSRDLKANLCIKLMAERDRAEVGAGRWAAFHEDCTCGAAILHHPSGTVTKGKAYNLTLERDTLRAELAACKAESQRYRSSLLGFVEYFEAIEDGEYPVKRPELRTFERVLLDKARETLAGGKP